MYKETDQHRNLSERNFVLNCDLRTATEMVGMGEEISVGV